MNATSTFELYLSLFPLLREKGLNFAQIGKLDLSYNYEIMSANLTQRGGCTV